MSQGSVVVCGICCPDGPATMRGGEFFCGHGRSKQKGLEVPLSIRFMQNGQQWPGSWVEGADAFGSLQCRTAMAGPPPSAGASFLSTFDLFVGVSCAVVNATGTGVLQHVIVQ